MTREVFTQVVHLLIAGVGALLRKITAWSEHKASKLGDLPRWFDSQDDLVHVWCSKFRSILIHGDLHYLLTD